jgi:hypothetical protein
MRPRFRPVSLIAALIAILLVILYSSFQSSLPSNEDPQLPTTGDADASIEVLFSEPNDPMSSTLRGGPDSLLAQSIDEARYSVDLALYDLNLWSIRDALLRAVVWTGSMNMTVNGAYRNDNNLVRIRSTVLAGNYTREFEEMFVEDRFGALSLHDTPHPMFTINDMQVEVYFSPDDNPEARIVELLLNAEQSIDFMVYAFTDDEIANALLDRASAGVAVRGVIERGQAGNEGSEYERLHQSGNDIRLDANERNMHHKVIVIDGKIVITGSYNFSRSAQEFNDENVLVLHDADIASRFLIEFGRVFNAGNP